jgi:NAD(P)-dependent dehydrogenase (short-subunit alcohol dehydrogenase family)
MQEKTVIITGANSGIGKAAALHLAQNGNRVILACRSQRRGEQAQAEISRKTGSGKVELLLVDLSSLQSVRAFVEAFKSRYLTLHGLINNAAVFDINRKERILSPEGYELLLATNYLGHFLLTDLLLDTLKESDSARILNISSKGIIAFPFLKIDFEDFHFEQRKYSVVKAYYQSKLALEMFTYALARQLEHSGVSVNCVRVPSVRLSDEKLASYPWLLRYAYAPKRRFAMLPEKMAEMYAHLLTSQQMQGVSGYCYDERGGAVTTSKYSRNKTEQERLWQVSEELTDDAQDN